MDERRMSWVAQLNQLVKNQHETLRLWDFAGESPIPKSHCKNDMAVLSVLAVSFFLRRTRTKEGVVLIETGENKPPNFDTLRGNCQN